MKRTRILSLLLAFVLVLSLVPALPVFAAEYNLWIGGVKVTDANKDNLGGGAFSYNPSSKILTVKGDYYGAGPIIKSQISGLVITNDSSDVEHGLETTSGDIIVSTAKLTFRNANLKLVCDKTTGTDATIWQNAGEELYIDNSRIDATGPYAIYGSSSGPKLTIENSNMWVSAEKYAINLFGPIELKDTRMDSPSGGQIHDGAVYNYDGTTIATWVVLKANLYAIWVGGEQVTYENRDNIAGGKFEFRDSTNTLYVKGNYGCSGTLIESYLPKLTIVNSPNADTQYTLTSYDSDVIESHGDLMISDANLSLVANGNSTNDASGAYIAKNNATLTVLNSQLDVLANYAFYGSTGAKLVMNNANAQLHTNRSDTYAIRKFAGGLTTTKCYMAEPFDGEMSSDGDLVDYNGDPAPYVEFINADPYDLWIDGTRADSKNKADILGDNRFSYDPSAKKLTIKPGSTAPASQYSSNDGIILNRIDGLTITTNAENRITLISHNDSAIVSEGASFKFENAKLELRSDNTNGVFLSGTASESLRITNSDIIAKGYSGLCGNGSGTNLVVQNSSVVAEGSYAGIFKFKGGFTVSDCTVTTPANYSLDSYGTVYDNDAGAIAKKVVIETSAAVTAYPIWIGGKQVTSANSADVLGNGVFSFDGSKTLTVKGSYKYTGSGNLILNKLDGLTIKVADEASLNAKEHAIVTETDLTIEGTKDKKLYVYSEGVGIYANSDNNVTVTLKNLKTSIVARYGIAGEDKNEKLVIQKSNVSVTGMNGGIVDFGFGIELTGCEIFLPSGAKIDGSDIVDKDGNETKRVHIAANPFKDVSKSEYYYTPVLWAYYAEPQITNGMDETHFGPKSTCTRGQIVTFLWRAFGEPAPATTENPFVDVKSTQYYAKAVLWAFENGITNGTDETHFAPNAKCKREHAVAFLYRAAGSPSYSNTDNPFVDVKASAYYYDAVLWAVENNITNGVSETKFGPAQPCQRAQIVTFLFRAFLP